MCLTDCHEMQDDLRMRGGVDGPEHADGADMELAHEHVAMLGFMGPAEAALQLEDLQMEGLDDEAAAAEVEAAANIEVAAAELAAQQELGLDGLPAAANGPAGDAAAANANQPADVHQHLVNQGVYAAAGRHRARKYSVAWYLANLDKPVTPGAYISVKKATFALLALKVKHTERDSAVDDHFAVNFAAYGGDKNPENYWPR